MSYADIVPIGVLKTAAGIALGASVALAATAFAVGYKLGQKATQEPRQINKALHADDAMFGVILRPDGTATVWQAAPGRERGFVSYKLEAGGLVSIENGSKSKLIVEKVEK